MVSPLMLSISKAFIFLRVLQEFTEGGSSRAVARVERYDAFPIL
jgi:hypothetical protein